VSAGELGTDARIEHELQKIMDIAHTWGAVLLLDEADVFLEKRQHQDVHRNALVSVFLRLLEYFHGILFLTTNRVETFDDAFQSRIHIALRYEELSPKAKREIWKVFIEKVREVNGQVNEFKETDFERLSRESLNGRQVCLATRFENGIRASHADQWNRLRTLSKQHRLLPCTRKLRCPWSTFVVSLTSPRASIATSRVVQAISMP
jgi:AAA+ superfamily predicted ATPase